MNEYIQTYLAQLNAVTIGFDWSMVTRLSVDLLQAIKNKNNVYICGNGGSAANATHLANDFIYGIAPQGNAMRVEALTANSAVLTCLGNDIGYKNIFAHQLKVKAQADDILLVLSGSGNSANILQAIEQAKLLKMKSYAILGFSGGDALNLVDNAIHFPVNDMQISEDLQLIVGHMLMQYLQAQLKTTLRDNEQ